jgi:O-antigen/teichoic acid export membrane protein
LVTTALIGGAWLALMTALLAQLAIDVVAGPEFQPSVDVLRIQSIAVLGSFLVIAATHVLISLARYRDLLVLSGMALVLSAGLTLTLAPEMGAQGGAIANAGGEGLAALLGLAFLARAEGGMRIPLTTVAKVALALVAGGALILLGLPQVVTAALATLVFGAVLLLLHAIPDELLDAVPLLRR